MHGGDIYNNDVDIDFSVNLNPYVMCATPLSGNDYSRGVAIMLEDAMQLGIDMGLDYPDIDQTAVRKQIALADGVDGSCVYAGCGASELIMAVTASVCPHHVLLPQPCFSGYAHAAGMPKGCMVSDFCHGEENGFAVTDRLIDAMTDDIDMLFLADPNNPTGLGMDDEVLEAVLDKAQRCGISVVLDESFFFLSDKYIRSYSSPAEYGRRCAALIGKYPDLYIIRSYTKSFALPGIRMGYVISRPENIKDIVRCLPEWNLPALSEAVMRCCAMISADGRFYINSMKMISEERHFLEDALRSAGMEVFPSESVYIMFRGPFGLYEDLLKEKILIRKLEDMYGLGECYYRIGVRCRHDNERLLEAVDNAKHSRQKV